MLRAKYSSLLGLVDSDDEISNVLGRKPFSGVRSLETTAPAKTSRAAITKPTPTMARPTAAPTGKAPGRKPLAEKAKNVQKMSVQGKGRKRPANEDPVLQEKDDELMEAGTVRKAGRGRPKAAKVQKTVEADDEPTEAQPEIDTQPPAKRGRKPKAKVTTPPIEPEIPETQQPEVEIPETQPVETTDLSIEEDEQVEELPSYNRAGMSSVQRAQPHVLFSASRRPVSASDSEFHDPFTRRRIGDLMRKYENLEAKYRDLRDIGVKEAEHNYDRLKKQGEERANTANQLIATLKAQLSAQTELAKESRRLRQQLEASQSKVDELQEKVSEANDDLADAKAEIKTLSTKLSAARSAEVTSVKVPGSAIKGSNVNNRLAANAEAAMQTAQLKEHLYGDLTGLVVCGVKRENDEEVYDCIQTSRNRSLHFKLAIECDGYSGKYDDNAQFMYMPQLDPKRDEELIETLPDYLVEEITFPRMHAAKFYSRIMKALSERPE
ncbi:chromosome segregation protein Csm1/Pcs1-domain-containing protein [Biscogniauxia marginata]|nr:chromosome segregation protein Csm1/Pcs1-domain-containing protein [Biscogniauxia marginata]